MAKKRNNQSIPLYFNPYYEKLHKYTEQKKAWKYVSKPSF